MTELEKTPANLDRYVSELFAREDDALAQAVVDMEREGLPGINVSASEGKLLHVLASVIGARRILEIGSLGGYSAIWLARALPAEGKLISLELDRHHADVATANIARAGLADKVQILVGPAAETLATLSDAPDQLFDLTFIDADKPSYPIYLDHALRLTRKGGLILGDNTLSHGVLDPEADTGIVRYNRAVAANANLLTVIVPTLRHQIDGLAISIRR